MSLSQCATATASWTAADATAIAATAAAVTATGAAASASVRSRAASAAPAAASTTTAASTTPTRASLSRGQRGERPVQASPTSLRSRSCSHRRSSARPSGCTTISTKRWHDAACSTSLGVPGIKRGQGVNPINTCRFRADRTSAPY